MTISTRRNRAASRTLLATVSALLIVGGALLFDASPAAAHDELVSTYPSADSTVPGSPDEITLSFSGELLTGMQSAVVEVFSPTGDNIATDAPTTDGVSITQHIAAGQPNGTFTVRWKVVSGDGHPISGEYVYTVDVVPTPGGDPTPLQSATSEQSQETGTPAPSATTDADAGDHGQASGGGEFLPVLAVLSGVLVLGGILAVVLMVGRERRRRDRASDLARNASNLTPIDDGANET